MADMTDEEYDALDELWTKTTPRVNFSRPGAFARQRILLDCLDAVAANYIQNRAEAAHKSPAAVIGELVREKINAAAEVSQYC
ncbi:MAG: hypothetical protein LBG90_07455 [Spirochaetaceae bacterium]|jgi:hypothetical protein|nr:hypothetical protein [Spirochaetaceae bacterium]